jgi:TPR repeat protein
MKTCPVCDTPFSGQHSTCPTDGAVLIESREPTPGHIARNKYRIVSKMGQGLGDAPDAEKARSISQRACELRSLSSCARRSFLYQVARNNSEGRKYFTKACDGGLSEGRILFRGVQ